LKGRKDDKIKITTFHIINETGMDKCKIWVIGCAKKPHTFHQNQVNPANLPVVYHHNKIVWLLTSLWYKFLCGLNDEMQIMKCYITLVTDNCPIHPLPTSPPIDYKGPTPLILTHITLIYLPPCTTAFLQPLDAGIIASPKVAYRRWYAKFIVEYFNSYGKSPSKLDILQAIYLIAESLESVTQAIIMHCWKKA
ncbi:DDE-domain-containing protein, partial [Choiromyces venosus 120613-1]